MSEAPVRRVRSKGAVAYTELLRATKASGINHGVDPDDLPHLERKTTIKRGDLFVWPSGHRLVCGDATDSSTLWRLCAPAPGPNILTASPPPVVRCVWTDPPYGVSYTGKTKDSLTIQNDGQASLSDLLKATFAAVDTVLLPGAALYIAHPAGPNSLVFGVRVISQGWKFKETLVWVKDSMVLGHSDYHYRHEPILYAMKPLESGRAGRGSEGWHGTNEEDTVFEVKRPSRSSEHPTMKPVRLIEMMIRNSATAGDVVLDPFAGSGSTLVAAAKQGMLGYGVELEPAYADVVVRRLSRFLNETPEKIEL